VVSHRTGPRPEPESSCTGIPNRVSLHISASFDRSPSMRDEHGVMPPLTTTPQSPVALFLARDMVGAQRRVSRNPDFVRVRPGVYAAHEAWRALKPWERYATRVHAFAQVSPGTVFSHESAAVAHGLPIFGEPRDIHVFDPDRTTSRRFGDVAVHASRTDRAIEACGTLLVTDIAHTAVDLGRVLPPAFGLAVIDRAAQSCGIERLAQLAAAQRAARGRAMLRWLHAHADPRSESAGESVSRAVISWLGFAAPDLQLEVRCEGFRYRVDFAWEGGRIIGESDGYGKYLTGDPELTKARLVAEKVREDRLRRSGAAVARWDWSAVMRGTPLGERLHRAGVRQPRRPQHAMLATLGAHPRSFASAEPVPIPSQ